MRKEERALDIPQNRQDRVFARYQEELEQKALSVLRSGRYILSEETAAFEEEFAAYLGCRHVIGVSSGLDALRMTMRMLGIGRGDEVILPGNTCIATALAVSACGATPVFADVDEYFSLDVTSAERKLTEKTKAVLPVHLYGQPADMQALTAFAAQNGLLLLEDCAQSHGASCGGKKTGTYGDAGCFSFYPTKNLGGYGDGGCVATDDDDLAARLRVCRDYGREARDCHTMRGENARLDELQAGLLRVRLAHLDEDNAVRAAICEQYRNGIRNEAVILPRVRPGTTAVWHQFVLRVKNRPAFIRHMEAHGIGTLVHYPAPPYLTEAYADAGMSRGALPCAERFCDEVVSLPLFVGMTGRETERVIEAVNAFPEKAWDER